MIDTYDFQNKVGDQVECWVVVRDRDERFLFPCKISTQSLVGDQKAKLREHLSSLKDRAMAFVLNRGAVNIGVEMSWRAFTPVRKLNFQSLTYFVQTGPKEFREVRPDGDGFGEAVDEKGWSKTFNCYV